MPNQPAGKDSGICANRPGSGPKPYTRAQETVANTPYALMLLLGAAIFTATLAPLPMAVAAAAAFILYGIAGSFWVMLFICPYCEFHGTRLCPCGYGRISVLMRPRQPENRFIQKFRIHIPVIFPLWFVPPVVAGVALHREFSLPVLILLAAFVLNSFIVLPLVSRKYCCASCSQKETCPWMKKRSAVAPAPEPSST